MRVFISSTCYDLIDLRAELEVFFKEAGVTPIMSDSLTSDFQVLPDRNSIETCLANVRDCDQFLCILSKRYGPSLKDVGYENISATHLEYREARKLNKPVLMFVRDRLEADHATSRKIPDGSSVELIWCSEPKMFAFLEEHRRLSEDKGKNNWFWLFRDSTELKRRLKVEFQETFARAQADRLFEGGRVPFLEVTTTYKGHHQGSINFELNIRNLSNVVAVNVRLHLDSAANERTLNSVASQDTVKHPVSWQNNPGSNLNLDVRLSYSILEGHRFCDQGTLSVYYFPHGQLVAVPPIDYVLKNRSYVGAETLMTPAS